MTDTPWLDRFVIESNMIEGITITGAALDKAVYWHQELLASACEVRDLVRFAYGACGPHCAPREFPNQNVRVGRHIAPQGGPQVIRTLEAIVSDAAYLNPFDTHRDFLTLHPFMDGNGRTGRALWLWQLATFPRNAREFERAKALGFLHTFYYQTLAAHDARQQG